MFRTEDTESSEFGKPIRFAGKNLAITHIWKTYSRNQGVINILRVYIVINKKKL